MAGWHHRLDGHEFEWTPGVGDGQGGLASCDSWGRKESDMTERLNWTESHFDFLLPITPNQLSYLSYLLCTVFPSYCSVEIWGWQRKPCLVVWWHKILILICEILSALPPVPIIPWLGNPWPLSVLKQIECQAPESYGLFRFDGFQHVL